MAPKNNTNALKHGGESAIYRLHDGGDFTSLALDRQRAVEAELAMDGAGKIVERRAVRKQSCSDIWYGVFIAAAEAGDEERMHAAISRYNWIERLAMQGWRDLRAYRSTAGPTLDELLNRGDTDES
jgi:hypothetical protein